ncbi:MAG: DUF934 domain-containing protein [Rhodobacteraceae bacterium]|nr:DUF934 domain-containing protein [Paracoccaceae bacterium]
MTVLVKDCGFVPDDWTTGYVPLRALSDAPGSIGVDLSIPELGRGDWARLCALLPELGLVRIRLRHFADVAALDLARAIRAQGFEGRMRAHGAVLARLYTLARRAGYDEIELDREQARLQPAEHWRNETGWSPARHRGGARPLGAGLP